MCKKGSANSFEICFISVDRLGSHPVLTARSHNFYQVPLVPAENFVLISTKRQKGPGEQNRTEGSNFEKLAGFSTLENGSGAGGSKFPSPLGFAICESIFRIFILMDHYLRLRFSSVVKFESEMKSRIVLFFFVPFTFPHPI